MNFIAYSDESYLSGRYKSIATFSFPEKARSYIRPELLNILRDSDVSEFKWHKVKNAKYRLCAIKLIDAVFSFLGRYDVRIDVLI